MRWKAFVSVFLLLLAGTPAARAEEKKPVEPGPWQLTATLGLLLSQSSFSSNWKGGDKGSVVWTATSDATAERQFTKAFNLANHLQLAYGQTAQQVDDPKRGRVWDVPEKTTDLIALESTGRFTLDAFVDPYVAFRGETQFQDQSSPIGTIPFNPVKLKETAGIARLLDKTEDREAITRVGFGFRQTIARSFVDPVSKAKASFTANDGGFEWQTDVTRPILNKRVLYKGSLGVFKAVFYSKFDALKRYDAAAADSAAAHGTGYEAVADFWKAVNVNFQNTFSAQITKLLSVNLFAQWYYDKFDAAANVDPSLPFADQQREIQRNVRKAGQFKETLALGFTYRLL